MLDIPERCRTFDELNIFERKSVAIEFISKFVKEIAPSRDLDEKDGGWTKRIRSKFIEICPDECEARPESEESKQGEFLADYTWHEEKREKRLLFAAESEWARIDKSGDKTGWDRVDEDFDKLLAIKSPFKVLIFSSHPAESTRKDDKTNFTIDAAREKLTVSLMNYGHHLAGEVYIFIDFPSTGIPDSNGTYESFIWIAEKSGRPLRVVFEKGPCGVLTRPSV